MLDKLYAAWRARRVLLIGDTDGITPWIQAFLEELGAKPARVAPGASPEVLCRAMSEGRISAVILPEAHMLAAQEDLLTQLSALQTLLTEAREAGVPLVMLLSDESVYRAQQHPWYAREEDLTGGETQRGLIQSILQLYADGVSRGLMGDAVSIQCLRHMPCLCGRHPAAAQYAAWCREILAGELVHVAHPDMQGIFVHPLDVACGALCLGARYFAGEEPCTGIFNIGADLQNLCANRSAALRLIARSGGTRPICESNPPLPCSPPMLDGSRARLLCGVRNLISGDDALLFLFQWLQAVSQGTAYDEIHTQTQHYIKQLL